MPTDDKYYTGIKEADKKLREIPFQPSSIETIDYAMYDYLNEELDLHTTTNKGWKKVPIIWTSAERSFQVKHDKDLRDHEGALILPIITLERTSMIRDRAKMGFPGHIPTIKDKKGASSEFVVAKRIKQDKTANFQNAFSERRWASRSKVEFVRRKKINRVVIETITMPTPSWIAVTYSIILRTEYQQQMNDLLQPFIAKYGNINNFIVKRDKHRYEAFVQNNFGLKNNISAMGSEERKFESNIDIEVYGYLVGEGVNSEQPKYAVRENVVEWKMQRERVVVGDIREYSGDGIKRGYNKNAPDPDDYIE